MISTDDAATAAAERVRAAANTPWYKILCVQVIIAIAAGIALGQFHLQLGEMRRSSWSR